MDLDLYAADVLPEYRRTNGKGVLPNDVTFDMLCPQAQRAVRVVGQGTYYWDLRKHYKVIVPPRKKKTRGK